MTTTDLGSAFPSRTRANDIIEQLGQDIEDRVMQSVTTFLRSWKFPTPEVTVQAAPAPQVTINAPVEMPEQEAMTCTVEMPGIDRLVRVLNDIKGLLAAPVTRTVERSQDGMIETITDRRG